MLVCLCPFANQRPLCICKCCYQGPLFGCALAAGTPCEPGTFCDTGRADATGGYCHPVAEVLPAYAPAPASAPTPSEAPAGSPTGEPGPSPAMMPVTAGQACSTSSMYLVQKQILLKNGQWCVIGCVASNLTTNLAM